jgi:hypothetical protein
MKNITENVERYASAWNEKTAEAIKAGFKECCTDDVTYEDKQTPMIHGIDALVKLALLSYELFPGRTFSVLTAPEYFNHHCYYTWGVNIPGTGEKAGRDYVRYDDQNRITAIVGFLPV